MVGWAMNDELERAWKKKVLAQSGYHPGKKRTLSKDNYVPAETWPNTSKIKVHRVTPRSYPTILSSYSFCQVLRTLNNLITYFHCIQSLGYPSVIAVTDKLFLILYCKLTRITPSTKQHSTPHHRHTTWT